MRQAGGLCPPPWPPGRSALLTALRVTRLHFEVTFVPCTLRRFSLKLHRARFCSRFSKKAIDGHRRARFPFLVRGRTGKPGVLRSVGWQSRTGLSDWTERKARLRCLVRVLQRGGNSGCHALEGPLLPSSLSSPFLFPSFLPSSPGHQVWLWRLIVRNSLTVQWLGLDAFTATGPSSVPAGGINIPQPKR